MNSDTKKNPISVLNEYAAKNSISLIYDYTLKPSGEFLCTISTENSILSKGSGKKKQIAKSVAAESALSNLQISGISENYSKKLKVYVKNLKKSGTFLLINKNPFIYEYHVNETLIASGHDNICEVAKEKCAENALKKLEEVGINKIFKCENETKILESPEKIVKHPKVAENLEKSCQVSNLHAKDPRIYSQKSSLELKYLFYFEQKFSSFELTSHEYSEILHFSSEVHSISSILNTEIYELGSFALKILRNSKPVLDFAIVSQSADSESVSKIFERLTESRINYLQSKQNFSSHSLAKLSLQVEMIENVLNPYTGHSLIRLKSDSVTGNLYIYPSKNHPSILHYEWMKSDALIPSQQKVSSLLRHWRNKLQIEVPPELLDLLVQNFVTEDTPCGLGFRIICEKLSAGIFLPGSIGLVQGTFHDELLQHWPARFRYDTMKVAARTLISISQCDFSQLLD